MTDLDLTQLKKPFPGSIVFHKSPEDLAHGVAHRVAELAEQAIAARGVFLLGLAGGETPRRCYETLRHLPINWEHVQIFFGDERCLPKGHDQRNDTMVLATLLDQVTIPSGNIHRIIAEKGAIVAAQEYSELLQHYPSLDLVLLGMGEDGHTASLFPGNPCVTSGDSAVAVFDAPKPPPERVSLGLLTLQKAGHRIFLVTGKNKQAALLTLSNGAILPAAQVGLSEWHCDHAAWPKF